MNISAHVTHTELSEVSPSLVMAGKKEMIVVRSGSRLGWKLRQPFCCTELLWWRAKTNGFKVTVVV